MTEEFYQETDPLKRMELMKNQDVDAYTQRLWEARFGKKKPRKDNFVAAMLSLKFLVESDSIGTAASKKKQGAQAAVTLGLADLSRISEEEKKILFLELKNAVRRYVDVSVNGRGFTSVAFGLGQLSDNGIAKKVAAQISAIAFQAPHLLKMDQEFQLLSDAALEVYRENFPDREHYLNKV